VDFWFPSSSFVDGFFSGFVDPGITIREYATVLYRARMGARGTTWRDGGMGETAGQALETLDVGPCGPPEPPDRPCGPPEPPDRPCGPSGPCGAFIKLNVDRIHHSDHFRTSQTMQTTRRTTQTTRTTRRTMPTMQTMVESTRNKARELQRLYRGMGETAGQALETLDEELQGICKAYHEVTGAEGCNEVIPLRNFEH